MAIQKYQHSFGDMMPQSFSTMLDRFFQDSMAGRGRVSTFSPQVDAYETDKGYEIEVSLPGLKQEDIKVDFQQGRLTISGEPQSKTSKMTAATTWWKAPTARFSARFSCPIRWSPATFRPSLKTGCCACWCRKTNKNHASSDSNPGPARHSGQRADQPAAGISQPTMHPVQNSTDEKQGNSALEGALGSLDFVLVLYWWYIKMRLD